MKRNATILLGIFVLLTIQIGIHSSAEPMAEVVIDKMFVDAITYENTSVKVTVSAEVVVGKHMNRSVNSLVFPMIATGIVEDKPYKGIEEVRSLTEGVSTSIIKTQGYAYSILVSFKDRLNPGDVKNFTFSFVFKPKTILVEVADSMYRLVYRFYMPNATVEYNRSVMRIRLPSGAAVTKIENFGAVEMEEMDPLSASLVAVWNPFPKPLGYGWDFAVEFRRTESAIGGGTSSQTNNTAPNAVSSSPKEGLSLMEVFMLVLLSNFIVGATALVFYRRASRIPKVKSWPDESRSQDQGEVILDEGTIQMYREQLEKLDKDERGIVDLLVEKNGKIEQKELPELTGFSKSKVSRILKRLDYLGIVRRTSVGKTKVVEINPVIIKIFREYGEV